MKRPTLDQLLAQTWGPPDPIPLSTIFLQLLIPIALLILSPLPWLLLLIPLIRAHP